jgi:hypothetical protein
MPQPAQPTSTQRLVQRTAELIQSVADNPLADDVLEASVRNILYNVELARQVTFNPRAGRNRINAIQRQLQRMMGSTSPTLQKFFVESKRRGSNIINAMPVLAGDLGVTVARLDYTNRVSDLYKQFSSTLRSRGITNKRRISELFVRFVEESNLSTLVTPNMGDSARRVVERRYRNFVSEVRDSGIDEATFNTLKTNTDAFTNIQSEILRVAQEAGTSVDELTGIGFFHRQFTPDMQHRLKNRQLDELYALGQDGSPNGSQATAKSRSTWDYIIEDEYRVAEALGLVPDLTGVNRWKRSVETIQRHITEQTERIAKYTDNLNTEAPRQTQLETLQQKLRNVEINHQQNLVAATRRIAQQGEVVSSLPDGARRTVSQRKLDRLVSERDELISRFNAQSLELNTQINNYAPKLGLPGHSDAVLQRMNLKLEQLNQNLLSRQQQILEAYHEPLNQLATMLSEEGLVFDALNKVDPAVLEGLVSDGVMSKVPMPSTRVFEVMVRKYDLPFSNLNDLLITDPLRSFNEYSAQLQRQMGNSNMAQSLVRAASEQGWGVSSEAARLNPQYSGWLPITDVLSTNGFNLEALGLKGADGLYVPPIVAETFASMVDVATQPSHLAWLANLYQGLMRVTKASQLTSVGFVMKNFLGSTLAGLTAGANLLHFHTALGDIAAYMRSGFDAVDDTKRIFANNTMTARDILIQMKLNGRLNATSFVGESTSGSIAKLGELITPEYWSNRARWTGEAFMRGDFFEVMGQGGNIVDDITSRVAAVGMVPAAIFEDAMQLTVLKTRLGGDTLNTVMQTLSFGQVKTDDTFMGALEHLNKYFVQFDDVSRLDTFMNRNIMPFWTYMSRNIPMQIRHIMRNPGKTSTYMRLYATMNGEAQQRGEDLPEAAIPQWQFDGQPVFVADPNGNRNTWWILNAAGFDQLSDVWSMLFYDSDTQTSEGRVRVAGAEYTIPPWLDNIAGNTHSLIKTGYSLVSGEDLFTGNSIARGNTSFLGFEVPSIFGINPGVVRYVIENNVPYVRRLNKANPWERFGTTAQRNEFGEIIRQSRRSMFGAVRSDADTTIVGDDREVPGMVRLARTLGFSVTEVNVAQNMQRAHSFYTYEDGSRGFNTRANNALRQYETETDPQTRERLMHEHIMYRTMVLECEDAASDIELWLRQRGYSLSGEINEELRLNSPQERGDVVDALINTSPQ